MAGETRATPSYLELQQALREAPFEFGFFQALRRIECANTGKPRIGQAARPADEPLRLCQEPSLSFAPSTLSSFEPSSAGRAAHLFVRFFGLFGPNGPLPLHLSEYARDRMRNAGDSTLTAFADLFHHRLLTLFYRAWANASPVVNFDRPDSDRFSVYAAALIGLGMPSLRGRDAVPDLAKLHYAGRFSCGTRNAEGLAAVLADFFRLPVVIEEFVGHWLELPADARWHLGASPSNGQLGTTAIVGPRIWDRQYKFRVILGPLGIDDYRRLLPGGPSLTRLIAMIRNYLGDELAWDLNLVLRKEETPKIKLGEQGRLGWTTWLSCDTPDKGPDDLHLDALRYAD
jgi:type VI secretion system protein ImpH